MYLASHLRSILFLFFHPGWLWAQESSLALYVSFFPNAQFSIINYQKKIWLGQMDFFSCVVFILKNSFASNSGSRNFEFLMWAIKVTILTHSRMYEIIEFINFGFENKFEWILYISSHRNWLKIFTLKIFSPLNKLGTFFRIQWARNQVIMFWNINIRTLRIQFCFFLVEE